MANVCSVNCSGNGVHSVCVSWASCDPTCCTQQACGGSVGVSCATYPNCTPTCCYAQYSDCGGSNSADCSSCVAPTTCCNYAAPGCGGGPVTYGCAGHNQTQCQQDPVARCCDWSGSACVAKACPNVGYGNCTFCGCTPTGGCSSKSCASLSEGNCPTCGCTKQGTCPAYSCAGQGSSFCTTCACSQQQACLHKSCATLATTSPFLCSGCNECAGILTIDTNVDLTLYWSVGTQILDGTPGIWIDGDATHYVYAV